MAPWLVLLPFSRLPCCLLCFFQAEDGIRDIGVTGVQTCALPILGDPGVGHGHAPDVALVDDGAVPGGEGGAVPAPGEGLVDHHRLGHPSGRVPRVEDEVAVGPGRVVPEILLAPADGPAHRLGVGVDEQLGPIEAVSLVRVPGSVDPVAVEAAGPGVGQVAVRDPVGGYRHGDAFHRDGVVGMLEDAELDGGGMLREEGKVDPFAVPGGPEWVGPSGPDPHGHVPPSGSRRNSTTASGGAVRFTVWGCPCQGTGWASTPPRLPTPLPP